jgi:hypothetical protein
LKNVVPIGEDVSCFWILLRPVAPSF